MDMRFVNAPRENLEASLATEIRNALDRGSVFWLLPGGSNIGSITAVMERLGNGDNSGLTMMFADNFYGQPGHDASHEKLLENTGFKAYGATLLPVLDGSTEDDNIAHFEYQLDQQIAKADTVIAFLGIGSSGLVAGILPHTPSAYALKEHAVWYKMGDKIRMTITPAVLYKLNIAYIGAYGSEKGSILRSLQEGKTGVIDQPCQALHHVELVKVFTDQFSTVEADA